MPQSADISQNAGFISVSDETEMAAQVCIETEQEWNKNAKQRDDRNI